jgi:hypothetical protein
MTTKFNWKYLNIRLKFTTAGNKILKYNNQDYRQKINKTKKINILGYINIKICRLITFKYIFQWHLSHREWHASTHSLPTFLTPWKFLGMVLFYFYNNRPVYNLISSSNLLRFKISCNQPDHKEQCSLFTLPRNFNISSLLIVIISYSNPIRS